MMTTTAQPASVAELEDTGTWTKSKLTANGPPPYIHESGAAPAPEKEVLTTNQVVQRFSPPDSKASTSASIEQTQTEKTQTPEAVDSKEVVPLTDANIVTSPTISSLNSSSRLTTVKQPSRSYREHSFWHTAPWRPTHNIITDPEGSARFFIEVSEFTRGKQDVSIHDVTSNPHAASKGDRITVEEGKGSPVVGFAQFPHGTNDLIRLALGDSNQMSTVKWVDMKRSGEDDWALAVPTKAAEPKIFHFRSTKTSLSRSADDLASVATQTSDSSSAAACRWQLQVHGQRPAVDFGVVLGEQAIEDVEEARQASNV